MHQYIGMRAIFTLQSKLNQQIPNQNIVTPGLQHRCSSIAVALLLLLLMLMLFECEFSVAALYSLQCLRL